MAFTNLHTSIEYLKGVGSARADLLRKELGIRTLSDLLHFFPNRYLDRTQFFKVNGLLQNSAEVQVVGKIVNIKTVQQKRGSRLVATFIDDTGTMELVWFRGVKWIKESLKLNTAYVAFGKVNHFNGTFSMPHPELELVTEYKKSLQTAMQPVYPSTELLSKKGVTNRIVSKMIQNLFLELGNRFQENLPVAIIDKLHLISKGEALFNIHFPKSPQLLTKAQQRLKFEELFFIQLQLIRKNMIHKTQIKGYVFDTIGDYFNTFYNNYLPFELTNAQKRVVKEFRKDMSTGAQMNRLLQGDVGSGKTIVALLTILIALDNGFQAALIAPTEILANQHFIAITELLSEMDIHVKILTGSTKTKERRIIHAALEDGSLDILIGTHALFEDKVQFKKLGIAVIDEQHRFGVAQRAKMWMKSPSPQETSEPNEEKAATNNQTKVTAPIPPHILVMTATPIPRTLAMSVYGDLDISIIDELPPGRKQIITAHRYDSNRLSVFKFMKEEIAKGRQVYVVYPLIQESKKLDFKDLMDGYESISREFPQPKYQISIVHGQMKSADKDYEMNRFINHETQIMVATTVIEVGVNIPNASAMVIESAERFGLSQLHQLRGRVGRGAEQSFCILMTSFKLTSDAKTRLETMVATNDGFEIAEVDLKLRGPGDLMGTQQSGVLNLKIADLVKDGAILKRAREMAFELLKNDPNFLDPNNLQLKRTYQEITKNKAIWANIS
ncbi:ATP-dependent DNA helicase RecG [Aureibaculum sp. A20]|uniref:ATP-dependent DNA helicase RecG n=1 Tax=Aureibaculum flavum TaxID=2795986 RepID=A0ABS0WT47_9FLAO|nr:ATP-dependent DNA helicase RecG [Aureibaculum flavum]MBJ2175151.1 ATP-dependent DNA helicase RecG [Aureibaculum flavum]